MRTGTFRSTCSRSYVAANMTQSNNFTPLKLINTIDDIWKYAKVKIHWAVAHTERKSARESKKFLVAEHFMNRIESRSSSRESPLLQLADFKYTLTHTAVVRGRGRISRGRKNVVARMNRAFTCLFRYGL